MDNSKINIGLLVGGTSPERPISKYSGKAVYDSLKRMNYNVRIIDPAYGVNQPEDPVLFFADKDIYPLSNRNYIKAIESPHFDGIDLAFIALHGRWGEDGTIQSLLEFRNISYTGSGVLASSISMDKSMSKIMFQHFDVKTPTWFVVESCDRNYELVKNKIKKFFGYPCIIKPNDQGSTIGLTICRGDIEVEKALQLACKFSSKIIVEEFIEGLEISVGIIEESALPVLKIIPKHLLYDYECKYTDGMCEYEVPADLPKDVTEHLQHQGLLAYNSVRCSSYGRVDFRLSSQFIPYCLEVNTLPGLTSHSLIPKMAKAAGISYDELIDRIIKNSMK